MKFSGYKYFHYIVLLIAAIVLYGNTIKNKFALDDEFVIRQNDLVHQGVSGIPEIFTSPYFKDSQWNFGYRPLTKAMFALEYEVFGENPPVHHFINVLLYALCCIVLFRLFSWYFSEYTSKNFWLIAVLIFLAHPVHTEVVASLKNREEILCTLFSLLGMWTFLIYIDSNKIWAVFAGILCFSLAFLAKQSAVIFVFIVPATYALKSVLKKEKFLKILLNYRLWIALVVLLFLTYIFYKIPQWFLPPEKIDLLSFENPLHTEYTWLKKYMLAFYSFWVYIKITLLPHPLLYYYGMYVIPEPSPANIISWIGFAAIIASVWFILKRYRDRAFAAYGMLIFMAGLAPFLNLTVPINGIVAERMLFFPLFGFSVIAAFIIYNIDNNSLLLDKIKGKHTSTIWIVFGIIMAFYSIKTIIRNRQWEDSVTLFTADMGHLDESVKANDIYATAVFDEIYRSVTAGKTVKDMDAKLKDVIEKYNRTLELYPENPKAQHNLSTIYLSFFRDARNALLHAYKAKEMDPDNFKIYFNIAQAYQLLNKTDSAEYYYRKTAEMNKTFNAAWESLLRMYSDGRNIEKLNTLADEYNSLFPESDIAYAALGSVYISMRDTVRGVECFEKAIKVNPNIEKEKIVPIYQYYLMKKDTAKATYYSKMLR